jgi:hypothetical protein
MNDYVIAMVVLNDKKEEVFLEFSSEEELMQHVTKISQDYNFIPVKLDFINRYITLSTEEGDTMYLNIKKLSDDVLSNELEHIFKIRKG